MERGRVAFWNEDASYGFIARNDTSSCSCSGRARSGSHVRECPAADVFVHLSALTDATTLLVGQAVEFDVGPGRRGPEAVRVSVNVGAAP